VKPRHVILTVLATIVIFAAGVVTGGLLVRKANPPLPPPRGGPMARFDQLQRAVDNLDLRPEQRRKIRGIIRERQAYVADMMRLIEPDLPGLFVKLREDIRQELTPDQQRDLDQLWDRIQQRRLANRGGELVGRPGDDLGFPGEPPFPPPDGRRPPPPRGGELGLPRPGGPGPRRPPPPDRPPPDRPPPDRPPPDRPPPDRPPPDRPPPDRPPPDRPPPGSLPPPTNPQPQPPPQP